jgi:cardiolipin synthase (CMP-forming)
MVDGTASSPPRARKPSGERARKLVLALPNVLTYGRIVAVPAIVVCLFAFGTDEARWLALAIYTIACITDWFDGYLARIWEQQSLLGRMLDPIADKLLVGTVLLMFTADGTVSGGHVFAAVIILCREILVSGLREFLANLNQSDKIKVSQLAKWKTALQMVALGVLLAGQAGEKLIPGLHAIGLGLLWLAALLTLFTGYDYLRVAIKHAIDD